MKLIFILFVFIIANPLFGQTFSGRVINSNNNLPIEFVNIGIAGKNIGTTSDIFGNYIIKIDSVYKNDSILFSCIGFIPLSIKVIDFIKLNNRNIKLSKKTYKINEVVINPKYFKEKTLGLSTKTKMIQTGFKDNMLGYECGLLFHVKKSAILERVIINVATCTYDSIFYRLNIYRQSGNMKFENILHKPIYINLQKDQIENSMSIDLKPMNIVVDGNFLITLEHVKDLGSGYLYFSAGFSKKTYYRKTSQGVWDTSPAGVSMSVIAKVEQ